MGKRNNVCLFDLDGTLADFDHSMRVGLAKLASPAETQTYWLEQANEPAYIAERRRVIKRVPGFWRDLEPIDLGMQVFREAVRLGLRNSILTKAPRSNFPAWSEKVEWCHKHLLPIDPQAQVNLVEDKGLVYGKVLVDDWPAYIEAWLEWRPRGKVIMPAQLWNAGFTHPNILRLTPDTIEAAFEILRAVK